MKKEIDLMFKESKKILLEELKATKNFNELRDYMVTVCKVLIDDYRSMNFTLTMDKLLNEKTEDK